MTTVIGRTTGALRDLIDRMRGETGDDASAVAQLAEASTRTLSQQALWMLGLGRQPFTDNAMVGELFSDYAVDMQINMLSEHLRTGEMLPILRGEHGSGKTSLLIQLMSRSGDDFHYFVVRGKPTLSAERVIVDMLRVLVRPVPEGAEQCFRELARQLRELTSNGQPAVLVIDDADLMPLTELANLLAAHDSLRHATGDRFRLLLAGQPSLEPSIADLPSSQVAAGQLFSANVRPLNRARTGPYLLHRLQMAGFAGEHPLDDELLTRIVENSDGLPRSVEAAAAAAINARWPD